MLLLLDHFDSFTHNIAQCFIQLGVETQVVRAHAHAREACLALCPHYLVLGPGPGAPMHASLARTLIHQWAGQIPILGICLGHQLIAEMYGGIVKRASQPIHGKTSSIFHQETSLFYGIPQGFRATRYHSLVVDPDSLPSCLAVTAWTATGEIMGVRHQVFPIEGVQFHPESILSEYGLSIFQNFIDSRFNIQ